MRTRRRILAGGIAVFLTLGLAVGQALAVVVFDGSTYDSANGLYVYSYSLENPSDAVDQLYWFGLRGVGGDDALDTAPVGWTGTLFGPDIDWIADWGAGAEVAAGGALAGFSFHSLRAPGGMLTYEVWGDGDPDYSYYTGTIEGPSAVPEPSIGLLLLVGIVPLGIIYRRRKHSASTRT